MTIERQDTGRRGEDLAAAFLEHHGYRILETNFRTKIGEIDIIAKEADTICFVEVKTRMSVTHGSGFEAISAFKRRKMTQTAQWYLARKKLYDINARFDVIAVLWRQGQKPQIKLLKNAFESAGD